MSKLPDANPTLTAYLVRQRRQAERQADSSAFARSGTAVTAEGVTTVDGELDVTGNLVVSGHAAITGTLSLPAGIIDNAALTSPVMPQAVHDDATNFAMTVAWVVRATATVTVPAGYTRALVFAVSQASVVNTSGALDQMYVDTLIDGVVPPGWAANTDVPSTNMGSGTTAGSKLLTGLAGGGTFTVAARVATANAAWAANAANSCNIDATVTFLR